MGNIYSNFKSSALYLIIFFFFFQTTIVSVKKMVSEITKTEFKIYLNTNIHSVLKPNLLYFGKTKRYETIPSK